MFIVFNKIMAMTLKQLERMVISEDENLHLRIDLLEKRLDKIETHLVSMGHQLNLIWDRVYKTEADVAWLKSNCATNDDLKSFATKEDLGVFATKEDLARFATKDDLEVFATKDDLLQFPNKGDLKSFATKEDLKVFATKGDLSQFANKKDLQNFATKEDLSQFATKEYLQNFATKDDFKILKTFISDSFKAAGLIRA